MKETIPSVKIIIIERIQNKWLWEKYCTMKKLMEKKNNNIANEMSLFHGTRNTKPITIYNSQEGFDMRHASVGSMWGTALYFAYNASYSNNFAYLCENGEKQIFMAKTALGDVIHIMPNDPNLKKPKVKGKNGVGITEDYDSVSGDTGGTKVYMIYDNGRAYPDYLITYRL